MNYSHVQQRLKELRENNGQKKQNLTEKKLYTFNKINKLQEEIKQE